MGTLKRFGKFRLSVFGSEHGRIHFHLNGPEANCSLDMETLEVLAGKAPAALLAEVRAWAAANRPVILAAWEEWNK